MFFSRKRKCYLIQWNYVTYQFPSELVGKVLSELHTSISLSVRVVRSGSGKWDRHVIRSMIPFDLSIACKPSTSEKCSHWLAWDVIDDKKKRKRKKRSKGNDRYLTEKEIEFRWWKERKFRIFQASPILKQWPLRQYL